MPEEQVTIRKGTFNKMLGGLVMALIVVAFAGGYFLGSGITGSATGQAAGQTADPQQQGQEGTKMQLSVGSAPVKGSASAPLIVMEFSDFSCPFCGAAAGQNQQVISYLQSRTPSWSAPVPGIMQDYVDTGKVRFVFKYFPGHGTGENAMKLALCANEQGKFWEVHDKFFANQDSIENIGILKNLAVEAGANLQKLEECYASGKYSSRPAADTAEGRNAGVSGTPTFYIGNDQIGYLTIVGAESYSSIKQAIEQQLAKV